MRGRLHTSFKLMPEASILQMALPRAGEYLLALLGLRGGIGVATGFSAAWRCLALRRFLGVASLTPGFFFRFVLTTRSLLFLRPALVASWQR